MNTRVKYCFFVIYIFQEIYFTVSFLKLQYCSSCYPKSSKTEDNSHTTNYHKRCIFAISSFLVFLVQNRVC